MNSKSFVSPLNATPVLLLTPEEISNITPSPPTSSKLKKAQSLYDVDLGASFTSQFSNIYFTTPKMAKYARVPRYTVEDLEKNLKILKEKPSDELLMRIKAILAVLKEIPNNLDITNLFHEALKAFNKKPMQNSMFLLLTRLHTLIEPHKMLHMYLDIGRNK